MVQLYAINLEVSFSCVASGAQQATRKSVRGVSLLRGPCQEKAATGPVVTRTSPPTNRACSAIIVVVLLPMMIHDSAGARDGDPRGRLL